ncbi:MAG TPA: hypothetical protein VLQ45_12060 [Thermoanaerobaculia bacterium]|nr:hypothetical protein [Thermoanaerobaculia bacterium]
MSRRVRSMILVLAILAFPDTLWRWLTGNAPGLAALWGKAGSEMDPDGVNAGGDMDPDGLKAGGEMDPNGRVIPLPAKTDAGGEMDPDG